MVQVYLLTLLIDEVQDDASISWRKRKKHFFILSHSGKPIYSRSALKQPPLQSAEWHILIRIQYTVVYFFLIIFSVLWDLLFLFYHLFEDMEMNTSLLDFLPLCKPSFHLLRMGTSPMNYGVALFSYKLIFWLPCYLVTPSFSAKS